MIKCILWGIKGIITFFLISMIVIYVHVPVVADALPRDNNEAKEYIMISVNSAVSTDEEMDNEINPVTGSSKENIYILGATEIVASGSCGDNLTWKLDNKGTLTISGTGKMKDFFYAGNEKAPWRDYKDKLKKLIIENGVTSIGNNAFFDCGGFTGNLIIPDSVTTIGDGAFSYCLGFTGNLNIPDSVTIIGYDAFFNCGGFTGSLIIPGSVTTIGAAAFGGCDGFTGSLIIPNSVMSIGDAAFDYCSGFTGSLIIPDSVTSIGNGTFYNCSGFTGGLIIPDNVTSIGSNAFDYCSGFTGNLIIPDSVTNIGECAFRGCSGFTDSLTIPDSVTEIGIWAFQDCRNIKIVVNNSSCSVDLTDISSNTWFDEKTNEHITSISNGTAVRDDYENNIEKVKKPFSDEDGNVTWNCIYFGNYWQTSDSNGDDQVTRDDKKDPIKWRVLDIDSNGNALLLSDKLLDIIEYNDKPTSVTWENSTIRSFLNNYGANSNQSKKDFSYDGFLKNAFSHTEINAISVTNVDNEDNPIFGTDGGNTTNDRIFCLSLSEAMNSEYGFVANEFKERDYNSTYTDNDISRVGQITYYVKDKNGYDINRLSKNSMWWLRSPGSHNSATYVNSLGTIFPDGEFVDYNHVCVRPALRINLSSSKSLWNYAGTVKSNENPTTVVSYNDKEIEFSWDINRLLSSDCSESMDWDLAIAAMVLSTKTYQSSNDVDETLKTLGLINEINDSWRQDYNYSEKLGTAHTIGLRKYEHNGQKYNLISIIIRGTQDLLKDGFTDLFIPFEEDAKRILKDDVIKFLSDRGIDIKDSKNRFFITGHSLGGADANNIAAALNTSYGINGSHITCYTFASPFSTFLPDPGKLFIKNYINEDDGVPRYPQFLNSYFRHGFDKKFYPKIDSNFEKCYRDLTGNNFSDTANIYEEHMTDTYMAAVLSRSKYMIAPNSRFIISRCPVDIYLLDLQGNVIASIVNNKINESSDPDVKMFVIGDEKCLSLPTESQYYLKLVGNDTGTMIYEILDYSYDELCQATGNKRNYYENVSLKKNKTMISVVSNEVENEDISLYTIDENGRLLKIISNTGVETDAVQISGLSFDPQSISLKAGESRKLNVNIIPDNATCKYVSWTSSNPSTVSVDNIGNVTGICNGTGTITATSLDGGFKAQCTVNVGDEASDDNNERAHPVDPSNNKPMDYRQEIRGDYIIGYYSSVPFWGKSKLSPSYFGTITVSGNGNTYMASKIKVNKKKNTIQITGLNDADKDVVKNIKKATKGSSGLPFTINPYYVSDAESVVVKMKKNESIGSIKIKINDKDYKCKKKEWDYNKDTKVIAFKGKNLTGTYAVK